MKFLAATAVTVCALSAGVSAQAAGSAKVIKLVAVQQSQKDIPNGFVIKDNDFIAGKKVGHDTLTCKVASSQQKANCKVLFQLTGGTMKGTVAIVFSKSQGGGTITGGTGNYARAKGKLAFRNLNEKGTRTAITLTLT